MGTREAAYRALARRLRTSILQGRYADGGRLPTEAELAREYDISRQTVRRAFHDLVAEGMVRRVPGRGTFAQPRVGEYLRQFGSVEDLMGLSLDTHLEVVRPLRRQVDVNAAGRLRLPDDVVHHMVFSRSHDAVAFCVTGVYLPPDVGELLESMPEVATVGAVSEITVIGLIDARTPHPIAEAEQSITAVAADGVVATELGCAVGDPLLRVDRLYLTTDGRPVELAISHFLPEQYSYRVKLRRSAPQGA